MTGLVESIDLLSVKIRTFDNRYIQVSNETVIKDVLVNVTRFPIRRLDFRVTVPHGSDTAAIEAGIRQAAVDIPNVFPDFIAVKNTISNAHGNPRALADQSRFSERGSQRLRRASRAHGTPKICAPGDYSLP